MAVSEKQRRLNQYFTPAWVAEAIIRRHFSDLTAKDFVVEPMCGPGRFLEAIPLHVPAMGNEIDPVEAQIARDRTGRHVVTGDFRDLILPTQPTAFVGNPPFVASLFDEFLDKAYQWLAKDGRVGMILPTYFFQTASAVVRFNENWSVQMEMIPRNIYKGLEKPLCFATFRKDDLKLLVGFSLYHEQEFVNKLPADAREAMIDGRSTWKSVVQAAWDVAANENGEWSLQDIYAYVADRRPTHNPEWKAQVRKINQAFAERVGRSRYRRKASESAAAKYLTDFG